MAHGLTIDLSDTATGAMKRLDALVEDGELNQVTGRSAENLTKDHLLALDQERHNPLSPFHFYADAADATFFTESGRSVWLTIASPGIAQRRFGGKIESDSGKLLTIPNKDEPLAHSRIASEFGDDLFFWRSKRTGTMGLGLKGEPELRVMFWLKESVEQQPDPSVLPTDEEYQEHIGRDAGAFITRRLNRGQ